MVKKYFEETILKALRERLPEAKIETCVVSKNNGLELTGVTILCSGIDRIAPCIYLEKYEQMAKDGKGIEEIVNQILQVYEVGKRMSPVQAESFRFDLKTCPVFPKIIAFKGNEKMLQNCPHRKFLDLAVIYYSVMPQSTDENFFSVTITNKIANALHIKEQELYAKALKNMAEYRPVISLNMALLNVDIPGTDKLPSSMTVYTNEDQRYGAACLLTPEVFRPLAEATDSDIILLPSSVHDIIGIAKKDVCGKNCTTTIELTKMIQEINATVLMSEEILSTHPYLFSKETGQIQMWEN